MMKTGVSYKWAQVIGLVIIFAVANIQPGSAQTGANSTFQLGKEKAQKDPVPGEGRLVGSVVALGKKTKIPLAFIEVVGGKSIQADTRGKFDVTLDEGPHTVKVDCSGYKSLTINNLTILEGVDLYIKIELADNERAKFK